MRLFRPLLAKRLNRLIRENDAATANLIKALEAGKAADVISAQGDPNNIDCRRSLVDVFIGRVELYGDTLKIRCNVQEGQKMECPIGELSSSPMGQLVEVIYLNPK